MLVVQQEQNRKNNVSFCDYYENREKFNLSLMIDATNRCQLRCSYCYYGNKGSQKMHVGNVLAAASNLGAIFEPKLDEVNFHYMGGEPLLAWEEILELNATARSLFETKEVKFTWSLTSNLIALDEKKAEHMLKEKAGIHCSIDGPAKIHDKNRPYANGKPSFADVVKNIPLALQITPDDTARVTVRPEDVKSLSEITETILGLGFNYVGLFPAHGVIWNQKDVEEWAENIAAVHKTILNLYQYRKKVSTIIKLTQRGKEIDRFTYCGAGKGLWAIGVDGKLYFCHHLTNIPNFAIIDASQSAPEAIRAAIEQSVLPPDCEKIPEACIECPARNQCNGGCWTNNLLTNGKSIIPNQPECQLVRATAVALQDFMVETAPKNCLLFDNPCTECQKCYNNCYQCQSNCQDCQNSCEKACKDCQVCVICQGTCELTCQGCEGGCETRCEKNCDRCYFQKGSW